KAEIGALKDRRLHAESNLARVQGELETARQDAERLRGELGVAATEASAARARLAALEPELDRLRGDVARFAAQVQARGAGREGWRARALAVVRELDAFRARRSIRWLDGVSVSDNAWAMVGPAFRQLKDDTILFNGSLRGLALRPSANLQRIAFRA